jgi:hypothetical protein
MGFLSGATNFFVLSRIKLQSSKKNHRKEMIKLAIEDTYNGATAAMTFMNAYIKTVADVAFQRKVDRFSG